ncbi:hypothetical protein B0T21DRAFT_139580 [Apiosordaria backusii]|uniref:Uncharacterized protein n=1 Tax=Apiosordaria backusii TaxID=314023 RepID=A0AA40BS05_9PEZI|nr:hypothetical protein B0T21DRAFT_139580 [Apiosordaria backusii]
MHADSSCHLNSVFLTRNAMKGTRPIRPKDDAWTQIPQEPPPPHSRVVCPRDFSFLITLTPY